MATPPFNACGGYRQLDAYTMASLVQLEAHPFCGRFLNRTNDPRGRPFDPMTSALHSGVQGRLWR